MTSPRLPTRTTAGMKVGITKTFRVFANRLPSTQSRDMATSLLPAAMLALKAQEDDGEPFEDKMKRLVAQLREQQAEAAKLDDAIAANLKDLAYGG